MSASRLDANKTAPAAAGGRETRRFVCLECGGDVVSTAANAEFCCVEHRKAWNNRRAMRGAEIYDLIMVLRFDRGRAKYLRVWTLMCRMASLFRAEDYRDRAGRRSWLPAEQVLERKPYLHALVVHRRGGR